MPSSVPCSNKASSDLFETVVAKGYCIGCGACAVFDPQIRMKLDTCGRYVAARPAVASVSAVADRVCPFADAAANEDDLAEETFGDSPRDPHLGFYRATYAGWVTESTFRANGSSGGIATWLLSELLQRGLVDYVVHVGPAEGSGAGAPLFEYAISSRPEEVVARAKSRYYPIEMSGVLSAMLRRPGRYAIVGVPCFVKAVRLACRESAVLKDRVAFTVGIVCGHLKSAGFAEMLAWQTGIPPWELRDVDFRTKLPDRPANRYGITATGESSNGRVVVTKAMSELYGGNWGYGFFKYKACDFCDDVVGETADISIGDAWLPEYERDAAGTNMLVVRSEFLMALLNEAADNGRLQLRTIAPEKAVESQAGGFRHRRQGLAYRLLLEDESRRWRPKKRVAASGAGLSRRLREVQVMRQTLRDASHVAWADAKRKRDLAAFLLAMQPLTARYDRLMRGHFVRRTLSSVKRLLGRLMGFVTSRRAASIQSK